MKFWTPCTLVHLLLFLTKIVFFGWFTVTLIWGCYFESSVWNFLFINHFEFQISKKSQLKKGDLKNWSPRDPILLSITIFRSDRDLLPYLDDSEHLGVLVVVTTKMKILIFTRRLYPLEQRSKRLNLNRFCR